MCLLKKILKRLLKMGLREGSLQCKECKDMRSLLICYEKAEYHIDTQICGICYEKYLEKYGANDLWFMRRDRDGNIIRGRGGKWRKK